MTNPSFKLLAKLTRLAYQHNFPGASPDGTNFGDPATRILSRVKLLEILGNMAPAIGRQQQQRHLRKLLKPVSVPTTAGMAIWLGWAQLAKSLNASMRNGADRRGDGLDDGQSKLWQNVVMLACATSSICAYEGQPPPSIVDTIGKGKLPRLFDETPDMRVFCEQFVRECVDLLASPPVHVRETIKEALGNELPPVWAKVMVSQMIQ